ncbi:MAG TPA: PrsW family glutamic-type intramembrane protease, partial [Polyangiaceae bacterium]|nr:PrsW family glutamic-type intramembrane protease [Polyangiaceae bacterium]
MLASGLVAVGLLACGYWLYRRLSRYRSMSVGTAAILGGAGFVAACLAIPCEQWVLKAAGIELVVPVGAGLRASWQAMLAMLLFVVPLEEAIKVGIVWPLYLRHRFNDGMVGVRYAVFVALGFAAGETIINARMAGGSWLTLLRAVLAVPAHVFFAGLWGYVLGGTLRQRHFLLTFIACTALHAIYDHIVFARGAALLVVAVPMFATMAWGEWALFRDGETRSQLPTSVYTLFEPTSVGSVRRAWGATRGHGLKLHWIFWGALVNLG